jgi:hypothetical protein
MQHLKENHEEIGSRGELEVTPRQLFSCPQTSMKNMNCEVVTELDFTEEEKLMF